MRQGQVHVGDSVRVVKTGAIMGKALYGYTGVVVAEKRRMVLVTTEQTNVFGGTSFWMPRKWIAKRYN